MCLPVLQQLAIMANVAGFNNIELITDRPLEVNLQEIYETKRNFLITQLLPR